MNMKLKIISPNMVVAGYASTRIEDTQGDTFTPDMLRESAELYATENRIVYYCHKKDAPAGLILSEHLGSDGKLHKTGVDEVGWYVVSRPSAASRNRIREQISEGMLTGHSIGGFRKRGGKVEITDLSYVPIPANRLAFHRIISKSDDDVHARLARASSFAEALKIIAKAKPSYVPQAREPLGPPSNIHEQLAQASSFTEGLRIISKAKLSYVPKPANRLTRHRIDDIRQRLDRASSFAEALRIIAKERAAK